MGEVCHLSKDMNLGQYGRISALIRAFNTQDWFSLSPQDKDG